MKSFITLLFVLTCTVGCKDGIHQEFIVGFLRTEAYLDQRCVYLEMLPLDKVNDSSMVIERKKAEEAIEKIKHFESINKPK